MTVALLRELFEHQEWADAEMWQAVKASPAALEDVKLREYLAHIHFVQRAFLRAWRGEPRDAAYPTFEDTLAIEVWARPYYAEARAHLASVSDEHIREPMVLPWASMVQARLGRPPTATTLADTALQVVLHSTYHRGQAHARLRAAGGDPPLVDYIAWIWFGRPTPRWDT